MTFQYICRSCPLGREVTSTEWNRRFPTCTPYLANGYYRCRRAMLVTDAELDSPEFLRRWRAYADRTLTYRTARRTLFNMLRDFKGWFADAATGEEVMLETDLIDEIDDTWFRDSLCRPCPPDATPRIRGAVRERWRIALTILRADCRLKHGPVNDPGRNIPAPNPSAQRERGPSCNSCRRHSSARPKKGKKRDV